MFERSEKARPTICKAPAALPYVKDTFRVQPDGYVHAFIKPGLGWEIA